HEGAEGDRSAQRDVQCGSEDRHRRVNRRRQAGRGLRSEDPEVRDLARERGHLSSLQVRNRFPDGAFRLGDDRLAVEGGADGVETVHREVHGVIVRRHRLTLLDQTGEPQSDLVSDPGDHVVPVEQHVRGPLPARAYLTRQARPAVGPKVAEPTISRTASETFFTSADVAGFSSCVVGPWATKTFGVRSVRPRAIFDGRSLPLTNPIGPGWTAGARKIALSCFAVRNASPPTRTRARTLIESKNVSSSAIPASSCSPYWSSVDRRSLRP